MEVIGLARSKDIMWVSLFSSKDGTRSDLFILVWAKVVSGMSGPCRKLRNPWRFGCKRDTLPSLAKHLLTGNGQIQSRSLTMAKFFYSKSSGPKSARKALQNHPHPYPRVVLKRGRSGCVRAMVSSVPRWKRREMSMWLLEDDSLATGKVLLINAPQLTTNKTSEC